jgi:cell division protease FtsH
MESKAAPAGGLRPTDTRARDTKDAPAKMPPKRTWPWFLLMLFANFVVLRLLQPAGEESITVPYTLFKEEVRKGNVESIYSRGDTLTGRFKMPVWKSS